MREFELIVRSVDVNGHGIVQAVYLNAVAAEKRGELAVPDISREFQLVLARNGCSACGCVDLLVFVEAGVGREVAEAAPIAALGGRESQPLVAAGRGIACSQLSTEGGVGGYRGVYCAGKVRPAGVRSIGG